MIICQRDGRVQGLGTVTIRNRDSDQPAGFKPGWSTTIQTVYQEVDQNGEDKRVEAAEVQERPDKAGTNGPGENVLSERGVMRATCIRGSRAIKWSGTRVYDSSVRSAV
jgi:hypothetical protein